MDAEREATGSYLSDEAAKLSAEWASLNKSKEEVCEARRVLEDNKKNLESYAREIYKRSQEVDELCRVGRIR